MHFLPFFIKNQSPSWIISFIFTMKENMKEVCVCVSEWVKKREREREWMRKSEIKRGNI